MLSAPPPARAPHAADREKRLRQPRAPIDIGAQLAIAGLFQVVARAMAHVRPEVAPEARLAPRTVIVFTHKRDLDIPVLIATLLGPRLWPRWLGRVTFVGSADLFIDGFLGYYYPQLGRPLRALLARTSIGPVLRALRIVPVTASGPRLVAQWLDDLRAVFPAVTPLGALLSEDGLAVAEALGVAEDATLAGARRWRYERLLTLQEPTGFLDSAAYGRLRVHEARAAPRRLAEVAAVLQMGGVVVISPEGQLSPDGALQPFRSGLGHLLRQTDEARVVPVGITYDLLAGGRRPRLFITAGEPITRLGALPRREADVRLRATLARLCTITLPHLVARWLFDESQGQQAIAAAALRRYVWSEAQAFAASGQRLDPLLRQARTFDKRFAALLREACGHGLRLEPSGVVAIDWRALRLPVEGWQENPFGYAYNELRSLLAADEPER